MEWSSWNGVNISDSTRNNWADELCQAVKSSDNDFKYIISGDNIVFACKVGDEVQIFDCKLLRYSEESLNSD